MKFSPCAFLPTGKEIAIAKFYPNNVGPEKSGGGAPGFLWHYHPNRESKVHKVKDLKGTKWEKSYIGIPDNVSVYLGDSNDLFELQIYEKDSKDSRVTFKKVFANQFIYSLNGKFAIPEPLIPNGSIEEILDEIEKQDSVRMSKEEYIKQSQEYVKRWIKITKNMLPAVVSNYMILFY